MSETELQQRSKLFLWILAASALPAWGALVAVVLYIALPTIDTVRHLNETMTTLSERVSSEARLTELRFRQVEAEQGAANKRLDQVAGHFDRRLEKLEDRQPFWGGGKR